MKAIKRSDEAGDGIPLALIGSGGFLEIAVRGGNAGEFFNPGPDDKVLVRFDSKKSLNRIPVMSGMPESSGKITIILGGILIVAGIFMLYGSKIPFRRVLCSAYYSILS